MKKHKTKNEESEVNMTPMLDIVFIMLIFFIVSSTFIRESGLDLTKHQTDEPQKPQQQSAKAIVIQICGDENIFVDKRIVDKRAVRANIERKQAEHTNTVVLIETAQQAPTGLLVAVMDQARKAKASISVAPLGGACNAESTALARR